jgi:hypothetical protein
VNEITFPLGPRMERPEVADLHGALALLGLTVRAAEQADQRFGASTRAAVVRFQSEQGLPVTGAVDEGTAGLINTLLDGKDDGTPEGPTVPELPGGPAPLPELPGGPAPLPELPGGPAPLPELPGGPTPVPAGRRVAGTVRHADGSAVGGLLIRAFHRRLGGELPLGNEALTDDRGHYTIGYPPPDGVDEIDLFVRAFDQQAVVAVSPIAIDAGGQQVLDLTVTAAELRGPSEFDRVTDALDAQLDGADPDGLDADDVALIVRTTGVARDGVTAWIAARRLAGRTGVDPESLYGLVRIEHTASLARLLRRAPARLVRSIEDAAESNLVSFAAGRRAGATVEQLRRLAARISSSREVPGSLGRLLATCRTASAAQQAGFLERYVAHPGPVRALWRSLREDGGFGDAVVDDLQLSLRLGTLTANHPPLVQALRDSGVRHAAQTAALDAARWRRLLRTRVDGGPVGVPATVKGATPAERQDNYVSLLRGRSARAFPTAHVARTLKTLPEWQSSTAVAFLDTNPDFNLLTADLRSGLDADGVLTQPDWDHTALRTELGTVQRVARVAPRGREEAVVNTLLGNGYTSALAVSRQSRATFRGRTAAAFGDGATADTVHRTAQFQVSRAANAYALLHPTVGGGYVTAVGGVSAEVESDPTWASLFGGVDFCACAHCRSVYGPAAYLVELLTWLDGHQHGAKTAFERLDERRPDIQRIELSCENTNTVLPYVDLLNEILEVRVLTGPRPRPGTPEVPRATTGTSPELLAGPEHLNPEAYDEHLARAVFPHTLPFDLWGRLGRGCFDHLGVTRWQLMDALRRRGAPTAAELDAERLGLSRAQWDILTGKARDEVWAYWGYPSAEPDGTDYKTDLRVVSTFLDRAGVEYDDLLDLLHSRFVGPDGIRITGADCDTDGMTITPLADDEVVDRMQRFLRLWRNRGWSMLELDKTLQALGIGPLDAVALGRLADLDRVLAMTGAPLLDVLSWWAPIDTFADRPEKDEPVKSLYDRVFLNRAVDAAAESPDFPLALNPARTELAAAPAWDDVRSLLQGALTIDADELAPLLDETLDGLPNEQRVVTGEDAGLDGLSALYRHVSLARRLGLTAAELLGMIRLVGLDPFDPADTGVLVRFLEAAEDIEAADFSLLELHYLLEHDPQAETSVGVTDEAIGEILVEIRDALARVATDYPVVADPIGETTGRYLAAVLDADAVAAVMTALRTPADTADPAELEAVLTAHLGFLPGLDAPRLAAAPLQRRFAVLVDLLAAHLQQTRGDAAVIEKVAGYCGRALDSTQDLLALRLRMTVDGRSVPALAGLRSAPYTATTGELLAVDDPEAFGTLRRLHKAALVLTRLGVDLDAQSWLLDIGVHNGLLDPLSLPAAPQPVSRGSWAAWARLVDLAALATELPGGEPSLVELLRMLDPEVPAVDPAAAEEIFLTELTTRTGWLRADLDALLLAFTPAFPDDWRSGTVLRQLTDAVALVGRLGVPAVQADRWVTAPIGPAEAEELRLAAKSKHDEERWPAVARALRDPVREEQRAALVAYLIAREDAYADEEDLYADLLIDVKMAPCMLTSRIKQAICTVQLFVQRAFLNLEDGVELDRDDQQQWEWMKNYRVWEAARKVFLYPENWVEPELRLDKSPLFERLENTLRQGELDDVTAERAYTAYLEGLLSIARLEVMGLYHQSEVDGDETVDLLHVVARTAAQPHVYYYRQWVDSREWTPWEEIDADIEGDHVILALHDRRLFLLWPSVAQKAEPVPATDPGAAPGQRDFFEMKLAWIERMNDQWGGRKLSDAVLTVEGLWDHNTASSEPGHSMGETAVHFRLADADSLTIECRQGVHPALPGAELLGTFVLDSGTGGMTAAASVQDLPVVAPGNAFVQRMRHVYLGSFTPGVPSGVGLLSGGTDESDRLVGEPETIGLVTTLTPSVAYPHQYGEFASQHGVFLDDSERTFHVMPEPALDWDRFTTSDGVEPADVGTTDGGAGVLVQETDPPYEPEIPWDKTQEPPLTSDNGLTRLAPANGRRPARLTGTGASALPAGTTLPAGGALTATTVQDLSTAGLQLTHTQLGESAVILDGLTVPTTHRYRFSLFYHPYVRDFMTELRRSGVAGLLDPSPDGPAPRLVRQEKSRLDFFVNGYAPTADVLEPYPVQDIDFETGGAYALYNWELFFHAPLMIAARLSQNQRFAEARRWFHFVFDPTNRSAESDPLRFWKIRPFHREPDAPIEDFLALAASTEDSAEAEAARAAFDRQIEAWTKDPFAPHEIAELRTTAYQKTVVMKYLDNLIAWGDQLFRQDTIESINEATQLYVLALELLGPRPDALPPRSVPVVTTYEQVRGDLAGTVLNNPLVQLENLIARPGDGRLATSPVITAATGWTGLLFPTPQIDLPAPAAGFYFAIPPNDKLTGYWDTVEDRLFKLRNCMNIEGVVRQLPLFEPPIDPGLLVRARAAGVDLSSALADLSAPLPHYRFPVMLQKAAALTQTVRGLGAALLSALEKDDAEAMATLRADQEVAVLEAVREVKKLAVKEAGHGLTAAERSLAVVEQRRDYYLRLTIAGLRPDEVLQTVLMDQARKKQKSGSTTIGIAAALPNIPAIVTGVSGALSSPVATSTVVAGLALAKAVELGAQALLIDAANRNTEAAIAGVTSGFARRGEEWLNQFTLAEREIRQVEKQIEAARVRVALAERDLDNSERQIENARSVRDFMEQKFSNAELYQWMTGQLSTLYFQGYQLAYDLAKQAEQAYRHELALPDATFVRFGYWDSLKKGLLAGERLQYDLDRMDIGYLENNRREYELTRHVSLALLDPVALVQLRTSGACEFSVLEALYDLDAPGQYLRRIKSVSITVPCVTGPYTGVPMRLTLVSSRTRVDPSAAGDYPIETSGDDLRFQLRTGGVESVVTSGGREDSGLFGSDSGDGRYVPFEGSGAVSDWSLALTSAVPTFDWDTITDVVLHVRYTAREGGDLLRAAALRSLGAELDGLPLRRAFSARGEFPSEWNAFLRPADGTDPVLGVELAERLFPHFAHGAGLALTGLEVVALVRDPGGWTPTPLTVSTAGDRQEVELTGSPALFGGQPSAAVAYAGADPGHWDLSVPIGSAGAPAGWAEDLILIVTYRVELGLG